MSISPSQQNPSAKKIVAARFSREMVWAPVDEAFDVVTGAASGDAFGLTGDPRGIEPIDPQPQATIDGDDNANVIGETGNSDTINAMGGDDQVTVSIGSDTVNGGLGSDRLIIDYSAATTAFSAFSGPSANGALGGFNGGYTSNAGSVSYSSIEHFTITTGSGNDTILTGGPGDDVVNSGGGDDTVNLGAGVNQADGGTGVDGIATDMSAATGAIVWNLQTNSYVGPAGTTFTNFEYFNVVSTGVSNDVLTTANLARNDTVNLGGGDDVATVFQGSDSVNGGSGLDLLIIDFSAATTAVNTASGPTANVALGGFNGAYQAAGFSVGYSSIERIIITTGSAGDGITTGGGDDELRGGGGNDFLSSSAGNDLLDGGAGGDTLNAGDGDDTLNPGLGSDTANGGLGRDRLVVDYSAATTQVITQVGPTASVNGGFDGRYVDAAGNLVVYTSIEDVTLTSGISSDNIVTATGNDIISTGLGNDTINAGAGDDFLDGGVGNDTMTGGMGNDIYVVDSSSDVITESSGQGTDEIRTVLASYNLVFTANVENLTGTSSAGQSLTGNNDANVITGAGGNDFLDGSVGNDTLLGNSGNDSLNGGSGDDAMTGGAGNDIYFVDSAVDTVLENAGEGTDEIRTFLASYSIAALGNFENLTGIGGAQILTGNGGANVITGAGSNDQLFGGDGNDALVGNVGADLLDGGLGDDAMSGGLGNDNYVVDSAGDTVIENAGEGTDQISTNLASYSLAALVNVENLVGTVATGQLLTGNDGVNTIFGNNNGNDQLFGNGGDDMLFGQGGNDTLDGGAGLDTMIGGLGNDTYVVDVATDVATENAGEGTDTIRTALASYSLTFVTGGNVENLTGTSAAGQFLSGDGLSNHITGNTGADTLDGGAGIDTMSGGQGNDSYVVDDAGDVVTELAGEGTDTIRTALASYTLNSANVENLTGTLASGQTLTGDGAANVITGLGGNDTLDGGGGDDVLVGGAGGDRYIVDSAGDIVIENAGEGIDSINTALASYSIAALGNVENLIGTVTTGQSLTGNNAANTIAGGSGNDMLDGGFGFDVMAGGAGDDIYFVDNVFDRVDENAGAGTDEIRTNLASYTLAANVERLTGTATNGAQALRGNALDNVIAAGAGDDQIDLRDGGDDSVSGGLGNDGFFFGAAFTAADSVDGGAGANDQIGLQGDYTGANALTLGAGGVSNITGVEVIALLGGFSYSITAIQANLAAGQLLTVHATALGAADNFTFDGSAETDGGRFIVYGGLGIDTLTGGSGDDGFYFGEARFSANDTVNGGAGANDQLGLDGNYGSAGASFVLSGANVSGIELVALLQFTGAPPKSYFIATDQSFVAAGQTMTIWGVPVQTGITFNGSAETDGGRFMIYGGLGADTLTGGGGDDWFQGGAGGESMTGGAGADTFAYTAASQSTGVNFDTLVGFDDAADKIDLPGAVAGFAAPAAGTLTLASFDADLAAGVDALLGPNQAIVFTASAGDMAGRIFGVVDANGDGNYQAGSDFVFEFVSPVTPIDQVGLFI